MTDHNASPKQATKEDVIVGLRIQTLRKSRGLSQTALGIAIGVSFQQIQKYENGANRVGAGRLGEIARVLGASVSTFLRKGMTPLRRKRQRCSICCAPRAPSIC